MWRLNLFILSLFGQGVCPYPQEMGYVVWGIYHPLERGRGEQLAHGIARALLADSIVQEVAYIHNIRYEIQRIGTWLVISGSATVEGLYAFFTALRGSMERFPRRLQQGITPTATSHPLGLYFRRVYEDTAEADIRPLTVSRAFYEYWQGGRLRVVLRGRIPSPLLRAAKLLAPQETVPFTYIPPEMPSTLTPPPRQGPGIVYVRWSLPRTPTLAAFIAMWAHTRTLQRFLCEERQLACQMTWIPLPQGLELWIETTLPVATEAAVRDFLSRPYRPPSSSIATFFTWIHSPDNLFLSAWWSCTWGLPSLPRQLPSLPLRELTKAARSWRTVAFAISG